jgi:hypothetical protein
VIGEIAVKAVERIEVFSLWVGFADPPSRAAKLTITPCGDRFLREQALAGHAGELPAGAISELLAALSRDPVPQLDPALFEVPERALRAHYESMWTDDSPSHLVRVTLSTGHVITVRAETQQAFMLPLRIIDAATGGESKTFDPRLSRAMAALMPEGYPDKDRLAGQLGLLELTTEELARGEDQPAGLAEQAPAPVSQGPEGPVDTESVIDEIHRILRREESARERAESERTGRLSERLLRRNSLEEVRDLLARGASPNIADEHGQTALMFAGSPPLDRERFRLLVRAGADVEARRFDGCTGLHQACAGGMADAVEEWVRAGADVHARTPEGATPLMLGASWPAVVRLLLAAGADANAADRDGHTPLVYAILLQSCVGAEGHLEAMRKLLASGAEVNQRDQNETTPLGHARRTLSRVELQEEVCRAFNPNWGPWPGMKWDERRMAEAVCGLIASAGGRD